MKLFFALYTVLVVLNLVHHAHGTFFLRRCRLARLRLGHRVCFGGWRDYQQDHPATPQAAAPSQAPAPSAPVPSAPVPSAPPPPPPCRPGEYRPIDSGQCQSVIAKCDQPPNTQVFAYPERPCGCQPSSGTVLDLKKTICNTPPPNGSMFCETAKDGMSSACKVQCDFNFKWNPKTSKCIRDNLEGCPPPEDLASGPPGKGCVCLQPSDPRVSVQTGEKCGEVPYYDPADAAAGRDPPGRMVCQVDANDPTNSRCLAQCIAMYKLQGNSMCIPAGL